MKKVLILLGIVVVAVLCFTQCPGSNGDDDETYDSNIDEIVDEVTAVEGNVLTLASGLRVRVIGVDPSSPYVQMYLRQHVEGKEVSLVADRGIKASMDDSDEEIPAYVILDDTKPSVNHQLVIDNERVFNGDELSDSLEEIRPGNITPIIIEDLALYMKMRTFLVRTPNGIGTGFFINEDGLALTNNHVTATAKGVEACLYDDEAADDSQIYQHRVRPISHVLWTDKGLDISILQVQLNPGETVDYFKLAKKHVPQGTKLATYGNPYGLTATFTSGDLSAYRPDDTRPLVQYSMATNPGNSGGPVADPYGQIVAVHDLGFKDMQNVNAGIDILAVREVLDQLQLKYGGM